MVSSSDRILKLSPVIVEKGVEGKAISDQLSAFSSE